LNEQKAPPRMRQGDFAEDEPKNHEAVSSTVYVSELR